MKKTLQSIVAAVGLTAASMGGSYYGMGMYVAHHEESLARHRRVQLDNILGATQPIIAQAKYHFEEVHPVLGPREYDDERNSMGSAIAIHRDEEGRVYFLTSHHVVQKEDEINQSGLMQVGPFMIAPITRKGILQESNYGINESVEDNIVMDELELLATSEATLPTTFEMSINYQDLALLRTPGPSDYEVWEGPWAENLESGDRLYSAGFPGDWGKHIIDGVLRSASDSSRPDTLYPTTMPVNPGNSGGPVFRHNELTDNYEFCGLNLATFSEKGTSGMTPIHHIRSFLERVGYGHIAHGVLDDEE